MRFFRHTIAEYTCARHCGYHRSVVGATLSPVSIIAATVATIPLWVVSILNPWSFPWYYFFSIFAGELLMMFLAGFTCSFLLGPFAASGTTTCKQCGAPMFFAGRHFDPLGSKMPHWSDIVILVVFVGWNVAVWFAVKSGKV
jgi:hypothetical protein